MWKIVSHFVVMLVSIRIVVSQSRLCQHLLARGNNKRRLLGLNPDGVHKYIQTTKVIHTKVGQNDTLGMGERSNTAPSVDQMTVVTSVTSNVNDHKWDEPDISEQNKQRKTIIKTLLHVLLTQLMLTRRMG